MTLKHKVHANLYLYKQPLRQRLDMEGRGLTSVLATSEITSSELTSAMVYEVVPV